MRALALAMTVSFLACGDPADNLVIVELPLAGNTALADIKEIHVELFAESTTCGNLVRAGTGDDVEPVAQKVLGLTVDERRNGADRYVDALPVGTWNVRVQAFGETDNRLGYACETKTLTEGQTIVVEYSARERARPEGT